LIKEKMQKDDQPEPQKPSMKRKSRQTDRHKDDKTNYDNFENNRGKCHENAMKMA